MLPAFHRHARFGQPPGIGLAFIGEGIILRGMDESGWQVGEAGGAQRRQARIGKVLALAIIVQVAQGTASRSQK